MQANPEVVRKQDRPLATYLAAFTEAVAAGRTDRFEEAVKGAYAAGASEEDLLVALEMGRLLSEVPAPVRTEAYATIHAWRWIEARRRVQGPRDVAPQAA